MPIYRVAISGSNLIMDVEGKRERYGFKVARFVAAVSAKEAGKLALTLILESPQISRGARNNPADPPKLRVTETLKLPKGETAPTIQPGFAFCKSPKERLKK